MRRSDGGQPDRPGDVAAGAERGAPGRSVRSSRRARRTAAASIAAARAAFSGRRRGQRDDAQPMQLIAGGRHELELGALAADEHDLGALSSQRVRDRQRRHDVPGGPAGADHDPRRRQRPDGAPARAGSVDGLQPPGARVARC